MSNKQEFTFPYGGMGCFECACLLRTAREVVQNKIKLSEGLEGYQGSEELWDQDPGGRKAQRDKPGIWCCLLCKSTCPF